MALIKSLKAYFLKRLTDKKLVDFNINKSNSFLFLRYDRIGDMLISTPVYRALKLARPDSKIFVLASEANKEVLIDNPYVDKVIINHKNNIYRDFFGLLKLRKLRIDVCIEFDHSVVPHAILRLRIIDPKIIISVKKDGRYGVVADDLKMYNFYTDKPRSFHFRSIWLNTIQPLGISSDSLEYDLFLNANQEQLAINYLNQFSAKCKIGINLEGAVLGKKIHSNELKQICEGIQQINKNIQIVILTAPEKIKKTSSIIAQMSLNYVAVSYQTNSIQDVAALIKNLDLIISPDTSIVHVASSFNKPIVSIHENNRESYELFSPVSTLQKTVFSPSNKGISGFDVNKVIEYSNELIREILQ